MSDTGVPAIPLTWGGVNQIHRLIPSEEVTGKDSKRWGRKVECGPGVRIVHIDEVAIPKVFLAHHLGWARDSQIGLCWRHSWK